MDSTDFSNPDLLHFRQMRCRAPGTPPHRQSSTVHINKDKEAPEQGAVITSDQVA